MPRSRPPSDALADDVDPARSDPTVVRLVRARAELDAWTTPRPEYAARGRERVLAMAAVRDPAAEAARAREEARSRQRRGALRLGRLATAGMAVVVLLAVLAQATGRSLPGSPLYDLKRTHERVQVALERDPLDRGLRHLHQAETRLDEVRALSTGRSLAVGPAGPRPAVVLVSATALQPRAAASAGRVSATLAAMDVSTRTGSRLVEQVARTGGTAAPLEVLQEWSSVQVGLLSAVVPVVPDGARTRAEQSLDLLREVGASAATG